MKSHKKIKNLLLPYMENKLDEKKMKEVRNHLKKCDECRKELSSYKKIEEGLNKMKLKKASEDFWKNYWHSVYNRTERKIGWIFFSIGTIILLIFGVYSLIGEMIKESDMPLINKIGIGMLIIGGIVLFVSILREQLFARKNERYKEVEK